MSLLEALICLGCTRYICHRCSHGGSHDSATWPLATGQNFHPIPRICRVIQAVDHADQVKPSSPSDGSYSLNPDWVIKRATYEHTQGRVPPYMIYVDHDNKEIILAVRGLNLINDADYKVGHAEVGRRVRAPRSVEGRIVAVGGRGGDAAAVVGGERGEYEVVFAGHSLGSGVATLAAMVVANCWELLGGVPRNKLRCYAVAPVRCVSRGLAEKYADVIQSVALQDDFLPRTPTPLEDIFNLIFWCGGSIPPEVRTGIPADGEFEHIILSCNATSDHGIYWIEREAEKALLRMNDSSYAAVTTAPSLQRFQTLPTLNEEHKKTIERVEKEKMTYPATPEVEPILTNEATAGASGRISESRETNWVEMVKKLFHGYESQDPENDADTR
ncbi:hypothetical protein Syun_022030 [Stephania yunnanensis]|uniref:Fungal lipase-like domain-containing protein n=1 Tax=Stephania yunnanensis TaxID=152371 RepID=A0AAP0IHP9_9MAGN